MFFILILYCLFFYPLTRALCMHDINKKTFSSISSEVFTGSIKYYEKLETYLLNNIIPDILNIKNLPDSIKKNIIMLFSSLLFQNEKIKNSFILLYGIYFVSKKTIHKKKLSSFESKSIQDFFLEINAFLLTKSYENIIEKYNNKFKTIYENIQEIIEVLNNKEYCVTLMEEMPNFFINGILEGISFIENIKEKMFIYSLDKTNIEYINIVLQHTEKHINTIELIISEWIEYCTNMLHSREFRRENRLYKL